MAPQPTALVRGVPDSFDRAIVSNPDVELDVATTREQHAAYLRHLEEGGYQVIVVPSDPGHPDSVFVEDTAVVVGATAVVTHPGAPSRRGEVAPVAEMLGRWFPLASIEAPGTLDGGDVIVLPGRVLVGRSKRTDSGGIAQLSSIVDDLGFETSVVTVYEGLHLKSAVLPIDDQTMVVTPGAVDETALEGLRLLCEDEAERFKFSALPLAHGSVLVTANAPRTVESLQGLGFETVPVDVSQIQAADGGLTCMSVVFDIP